jgi:hypothetical protein
MATIGWARLYDHHHHLSPRLTGTARLYSIISHTPPFLINLFNNNIYIYIKKERLHGKMLSWQ